MRTRFSRLNLRDRGLGFIVGLRSLAVGAWAGSCRGGAPLAIGLSLCCGPRRGGSRRGGMSQPRSPSAWRRRGLPAESVVPAQAPGLFEVEVQGGDYLYVTPDCRYFIFGQPLRDPGTTTGSWLSPRAVAAPGVSRSSEGIAKADMLVFLAGRGSQGERPSCSPTRIAAIAGNCTSRCPSTTRSASKSATWPIPARASGRRATTAWCPHGAPRIPWMP